MKLFRVLMLLFHAGKWLTPSSLSLTALGLSCPHALCLISLGSKPLSETLYSKSPLHHRIFLTSCRYQRPSSAWLFQWCSYSIVNSRWCTASFFQLEWPSMAPQFIHIAFLIYTMHNDFIHLHWGHGRAAVHIGNTRFNILPKDTYTVVEDWTLALALQRLYIFTVNTGHLIWHTNL